MNTYLSPDDARFVQSILAIAGIPCRRKPTEIELDLVEVDPEHEAYLKAAIIGLTLRKTKESA